MLNFKALFNTFRGNPVVQPQQQQGIEPERILQQKMQEPREPENEEERPPTVKDLQNYYMQRKREVLDLVLEMKLFESCRLFERTGRKPDAPEVPALLRDNFVINSERLNLRGDIITVILNGNTVYAHSRVWPNPAANFLYEGAKKEYKPIDEVTTFRYGQWVEILLQYAEELKIYEQEKKELQEIETINRQLDALEPLDE